MDTPTARAWPGQSQETRALPSCFSSDYKPGPFSVVRALLFAFSWVIETSPNEHRAKVPSGVPERKKAETCPVKKTRVLEKPAVGSALMEQQCTSDMSLRKNTRKNVSVPTAWGGRDTKLPGTRPAQPHEQRFSSR